MVRLIVLGIFFLVFFNNDEINAVRFLYGHKADGMKTRLQLRKDIPKLIQSRSKSPTFVQSRRFHFDQYARDNRELGQLTSFQSQISSLNSYIHDGSGGNLALSSQEGCRLTTNPCSQDHQCCSGKCRCVRWTTTGRVSCLKKCF